MSDSTRGGTVWTVTYPPRIPRASKSPRDRPRKRAGSRGSTGTNDRCDLGSMS